CGSIDVALLVRCVVLLLVVGAAQTAVVITLPFESAAPSEVEYLLPLATTTTPSEHAATVQMGYDRHGGPLAGTGYPRFASGVLLALKRRAWVPCEEDPARWTAETRRADRADGARRRPARCRRGHRRHPQR